MTARRETSSAHSVAKVGDALLVGATRVDVGTAVDAGAAYLFTRQNSQWIHDRKLTASDGAETDERVGRSVGMTTDTMVIGSYHGGDGYVLERNGSDEWEETAIVSMSDPTKDEGFREIAVTDGMILNSLDSHDHNGIDSGAAYVFVKDSTRARQAYASSDTPSSLKDSKGRNAGITTSEITIADSGTIEDIDVRLNISHTRIRDLTAELIAPDGTTVTLFDRLSDSGADFNFTFFDDVADTEITTATAPFWGSFRPVESLNSLNGLEVNGTWQLRITDHNKGTIGTLDDWLIVAKYKLAQPSFSINDVTVVEGDSGTTTAQFTVTRSGNTSTTVSVDYQTQDGTQNGSATAPDDYVDIALSTLTFDVGETTKTVEVIVNGDMLDEGDEDFYVELSNASAGASIVKTVGVGTIQDDDAPIISTMHVADLEATATDASRGKWNAEVRILVVDASGNPLAGVTVNGDWSSGGPGTATTGADGIAVINVENINKRTTSVAFRITSLVHASFAYNEGDNDDLDGDSDGTEILILKP